MDHLKKVILAADRLGVRNVNTFIGREQMIEMMKTAGFADGTQFPLTCGVCVCYRGVKQ